MKNIIFIAPPAAGKGTQAKILSEKYNIPHISTGDLLREEASKSTELGMMIKDIISSGKFVSDQIITLSTCTDDNKGRKVVHAKLIG